VTDALRLAGISDHMDSVATLDEARQALRAAGL